MANKRVFAAQGLVTNGVSVGGLASLGLDASYADIVESTGDGAVGSEDVDRAGLRGAVDLECSDVAKAATILDAAVADTLFSGKESGAATWHDYTITNIVYTGMNMSLSKNADGRLSLSGALRFADGAKDLSDAVALVGGEAGAPTQTYPARLYRPHTASFTPEGGSAITPLHLESISLSLSANMVEGYSDTDIGHTAVDVLDWKALQVTMVHRDATVKGVAPDDYDISAEIMAANRGVLTVALLGRAGGTDMTLTINNLLWRGVKQSHGKGYTDYTMTGVAGWRKNAAPQKTYLLTGADKLFEIAA